MCWEAEEVDWWDWVVLRVNEGSGSFLYDIKYHMPSGVVGWDGMGYEWCKSNGSNQYFCRFTTESCASAELFPVEVESKAPQMCLCPVRRPKYSYFSVRNLLLLLEYQ